MNTENFDNMTALEKTAIVEKMDAEKLLNCFIMYHDNFCPIDYSFCESYEIIKNEILKRCGEG